MAKRRYHPTLVIMLARQLYSLTLITASALLLTACATGGYDDQVIIDGDFSEWENVAVAAADPADAPEGYLDFGEVRVRHDRDSVYMLVDMGRVLTAQRLPGTVSILLDVDGRAATGYTESGMEGVDLIFDFPLPNSKSPGTPGAGVRLRSQQERLNPYSLGVVFAPVHAGSRFEFRFNRRGPLGTTPPIFFAPEFRAKLSAVDLEGKLVDETNTFTYRLTPTNATSRRTSNGHNPIARSEHTDLRVLCWNVSRNDILEKPRTFGKILLALRPDIIVLDEVSDKGSLEQLRAIITDAFLGESWNVYFGPGGADQRTVVASRSPIENAPFLSPVAWPAGAAGELAALRGGGDEALAKATAWIGDTVPAGGAIVSFDSRRVLAAGVDLHCCGGYQTVEDRRRMIEVRGVNAAAAATIAASRIDATIIAGDFNLVGDPVVLDLAAAGLDNGQPLKRARALQLDGLSDATWSNPQEPFVPGRLDNLLFSSSSLELLRAFVFDSSDLSGRWLAYNGLSAQ
ncbi:MAG: endonuclease/exonuclease/phosphatase family protein, partial [Acidobacteria bacterium]|nr:endonuclease/exonuclease/phosphatase family protein [Acidobacteriota bacterium]